MSPGDHSSFDLDSLIRPRSIAVLGASPNVDRHTGRTVANLQRTGYQGTIYPVNPKYDEVLGLACYPAIRSLPEPPDAAYILLRADRVLDAVRDCAEAGVRSIVVCTSGFAEEGADGKAVQLEMARVARQHGSRVLGPNCIGVLNVFDSVVACPTFNITYDYKPGAVSVVSQSGGMGVNLLNRAQGRGIGIRTLISVGNEADIGVPELVYALVDDVETRVIALFLEEVRDVPAFVAAVGHARAAGKPVIALKVGASEAGARSSMGHTGAMTGSYEVFRDVMRQLGVLHAHSVDELLGAAMLLAEPGPPPSRRVLVVSPSGGECSYAADLAVERGLEIPALSERSQEALSTLMRFGNPNNPLDLTGQVIGDVALLRDVAAILEEEPNVDTVLYAIATWGEHDAERLLPTLIEAAGKSRKRTVLSAWSARGVTERADDLLRESDVTTFPSTDDALSALGLAAQRPAADLYLPEPVGGAAPMPVDWVGTPSEDSVKTFLGEQGMPVSREFVVDDADQARKAANELGWPLVAKQLCHGVTHKSDLGLVRAGLKSHDDVATAMEEFTRILGQLDLSSQGVLLAQQYSGLEVILGGVRDSSFGPVVMVGAGGVLAELLDDKAFALCPLTVSEATALIGRLRISRLLSGYRGSAYDVTALAVLVSRFSRLFAASPWIQELDLNPVIVHDAETGGATIVDAVLTVSHEASGRSSVPAT